VSDSEKTTGAIIAAAEARAAVNISKPIEEQLRAAMKVTKDSRMMGDDEVRFTGAVFAVMQTNEGNIKVYMQLMAEILALQSLKALSSPTPVDLETIRAAQRNFLEPIGLRQLWMEVAHPSATHLL